MPITKTTELEAAEEARQALTLEVQSLQAQLGDKQRSDENGNRLSSQKYWAWKRETQQELNHKLDQLREAKTTVRNLRSAIPRQMTNSVEIISNLLGILDTIDEADFSDKEKFKIMVAKNFVARDCDSISQTNQETQHQ